MIVVFVFGSVWSRCIDLGLNFSTWSRDGRLGLYCITIGIGMAFQKSIISA